MFFGFFERRRAVSARKARNADFERARKETIDELMEFVKDDARLLDEQAYHALEEKLKQTGTYESTMYLTDRHLDAVGRKNFSEAFASDLNQDNFIDALLALFQLKYEGMSLRRQENDAKAVVKAFAENWLAAQIRLAWSNRAEYLRLKEFFLCKFYRRVPGHSSGQGDTPYRILQYYYGVTFDSFEHEDWYRLLDWYEKAPVLSDFVDYEPNYTEGAFLERMADLVVRHESKKRWEFKLALALCASKDRYRIEAGTLREELAKLVEMTRSELPR